MPTRSRERPTRAQVLEKRTRVVELTHSGLTKGEVAAELGDINRSGVWKARQRALNAQLAESVEVHRAPGDAATWTLDSKCGGTRSWPATSRP